jgi:hypothetical protein
MTFLGMLTSEFEALSRAFAEPADPDALDQFARRLGELMILIGRTPPETVADCVGKLGVLAHRDLGIEAGDHEDDITSLRQVIDYLNRLP